MLWLSHDGHADSIWQLMAFALTSALPRLSQLTAVCDKKCWLTIWHHHIPRSWNKNPKLVCDLPLVSSGPTSCEHDSTEVSPVLPSAKSLMISGSSYPKGKAVKVQQVILLFGCKLVWSKQPLTKQTTINTNKPKGYCQFTSNSTTKSSSDSRHRPSSAKNGLQGT